MDCRLILGKNDSFFKMLHSSYESGDKVYLLYDENGMTRAEGFIKSIHNDGTDTMIELENELKIPVKDIMALNGIFLPEFAEC